MFSDTDGDGTTDIVEALSGTDPSPYASIQPPELLGFPSSEPIIGGVLCFLWTGNGTRVDEWRLVIGDTLGSSDYYDSGNLFGQVHPKYPKYLIFRQGFFMFGFTIEPVEQPGVLLTLRVLLIQMGMVWTTTMITVQMLKIRVKSILMVMAKAIVVMLMTTMTRYLMLLTIVSSFRSIDQLDSDNDSFGNDCDSDDYGDEIDVFDSCPISMLAPTVSIQLCDSGVNNFVQNNGCAISDDVASCALQAENHDKFRSCVSKLTNTIAKSGLLSGKEKGMIQKCAAKVDIE